MQTLILTAASEAEMMQVSEQLLSYCIAPCVIFLQGELGAGKTTLVRGLLRTLGYIGPVKSPTYTLVENYTIANKKIYHFDLYRVHDPEELELMGIRDYFQQDTLCFIEWPQQGHPFLPKPDIICEIEFLGQGRRIKIQSNLKQC